MKGKIIGLVFLGLVVVGGLVFFNAEVGEQVTEVLEIATATTQEVQQQVKVVRASGFDCAKNWDEINKFGERISAHSQGLTDEYPTDLEQAKIQQKGIDQAENRCFITVESWAHQSEYEDEIWDAKHWNEWRNLSHLNQIRLGESCVGIPQAECDKYVTQYQQTKKYVEQRLTHLESQK